MHTLHTLYQVFASLASFNVFLFLQKAQWGWAAGSQPTGFQLWVLPVQGWGSRSFGKAHGTPSPHPPPQGAGPAPSSPMTFVWKFPWYFWVQSGCSLPEREDWCWLLCFGWGLQIVFGFQWLSLWWRDSSVLLFCWVLFHLDLCGFDYLKWEQGNIKPDKHILYDNTKDGIMKTAWRL